MTDWRAEITLLLATAGVPADRLDTTVERLLDMLDQYAADRSHAMIRSLPGF